MTNHPSSQQKREELKNQLKWLVEFAKEGKGVESHIARILFWHEQEIAEAQKDQIIKDFLQYSLCTSVDEALLIEIKESQLEALRTKAPSPTEDQEYWDNWGRKIEESPGE